jgi:hypothetical protein
MHVTKVGKVVDEWVDLKELATKLAPTPVTDSNLPLMTSLLRAVPNTRASCLLVEFPPGWKRTAGSYSCTEHAVILSGSVILDGQVWLAGHGFIVSAGGLRTETFAPEGALAVAWFGGAPRWTSAGRGGDSTSGQTWNGDQGITVRDEVDTLGWRWRHVSQPEGQPGLGTFNYEWPSF